MISSEEVQWVHDLNENIQIKRMDGMNHWLGIQDGRESYILNEVSNFIDSFVG
jgi:hypothetical protein